ncbi:MAG: hypothetical protein ACM3PY_15205 [Omnitrophica WOR_2 bacterium]
MFRLRYEGAFEAVEPAFQKAALLDEWAVAPGGIPSQTWIKGEHYWLVYPPVGAIRFQPQSHVIRAYPVQGLDLRVFQAFLYHEWLPMVYATWGFQVLHASAAVKSDCGAVAAFTGVTGTGKSTLGYGLGQRTGWQQIADESLALQVRPGSVSLVPIPNDPRLRPSSSDYYGLDQATGERLAWPAGALHLDTIFFLEPQNDGDSSPSPARILPLNGADAYSLLLKQAFALTLKDRSTNRRLMQDYLQIASQAQVCRLIYKRSFSDLPMVLDAVENWVRHA